MTTQTQVTFSAVVSIHPLRGREFDNLPAALRYLGCLAATRYVTAEIRTEGTIYWTNGPAVTVSQDLIDYAASHKKER